MGLLKNIKELALLGLVGAAILAVTGHWPSFFPKLPSFGSLPSLKAAVNVEKDKVHVTKPIALRMTKTSLSCRVIVHSLVDVEAKAQVKVSIPFLGSAGLPYAHDTVLLKPVVADVAICFPEQWVAISQAPGSRLVVVRINAAHGLPNRPRVDAVATLRNRHYSGSFSRKLFAATPLAPFLNETGSQLTAESYAFTQLLVGGPTCLGKAWARGKQIIAASYQDQAKRKHLKAKVVFFGTPNFGKKVDELKFKDVTFSFKHIRCLIK